MQPVNPMSGIGFQFHKGTIKTFCEKSNSLVKVISIP